MAANHTAMFEVLYQVRQLISLTHKICQGRNMPSHTKMHMFTPKSAVGMDVGQNTDTMTMIGVMMAWWRGALCLLIDHLQKNTHPSLKLKLALWPKLVIIYQPNYNSMLMPGSQVPRDSLTAISLSSRALWLVVIWKRRCICGERLLLD